MGEVFGLSGREKNELNRNIQLNNDIEYLDSGIIIVQFYIQDKHVFYMKNIIFLLVNIYNYIIQYVLRVVQYIL